MLKLCRLFLQVIKSVQTYKSLVPFVSTSLLSRLITKKVWTSPQLWEGFIRCARVMGMASYNALLQLPRDQLKEIVSRPDGKLIKSGLKDFIVKRVRLLIHLPLLDRRRLTDVFSFLLQAGGNASKVPSWFSEVFPDEESATPTPSPSTPVPEAPTPAPPPTS